MSQDSIKKLMDRWTNDPDFRDRMREDPEGTVRSMGVELTDDQWAALRNMDWGSSDEELQARVSRRYC